MPRNREFAQVDVFSAIPYCGNPVAVILDAEGLGDAEMARIARWTNLSETTFVLPPTAPKADYRLRIFTPCGELPFAGHPTLGSASAWLAHGGTPRSADHLIQECAAGLIEIRRGGAGNPFTADSTGTPMAPVPSAHDAPETLSFAAPPLIRSGALEDSFLTEIATALGIDRAEILGHQWVDNGPGWAAVRLASAERVLTLKPDFSAIPDAKLGVVGAHPHGSAHEYEVRAFVPGVGVAEDPVTGSLNASLAQWLGSLGEVPDSYTATQGTAIGRSGIITITREGGTVWVGGATTICFTGTAYA